MKGWSEINNHKLVFIDYLPRSGSTYLCKLLDEYDGIDVGIEAGFPGYRKYLLPPKYNPINNKSQLKKYLDLLFQDLRFQQWNIDRSKFEQKLLSLDFPVKFDAILLCSLDEYFKDNEASIRIHKAGYFIDNWKEINELFPNSKSIYIIRDPRAIFNSQIEMQCLLNNQNKNHIFSLIISYKSRNKLLNNYSKNKNRLLVKYEDLINNTKSTIDRILTFIELTDKKKKNLNHNYLNKIPNYLQPIHTNINTKPIANNINKWQNTLPTEIIFFIDNILKKEMKYFGYSPAYLDLKNDEKKRYFRLVWKYRIFQIKKNIVDILKYFKLK